jgi:hypothetical protein
MREPAELFQLLSKLSNDLEILTILVRTATKLSNKQITPQNREAWVRKLAELTIIIIGWGKKVKAQIKTDAE